ncbi:MAG TPA: 2-phosphosulfolactate phosphatase, partial [Burkholderiales bacterium]
MSARLELNHKVHVLTKKEELDTVRVPGKVVVVLDILFATTTMVTALAHGATEVLPVLDEATARARAKELPPDSYVLSGELNADTLPGFAHPAPLSLVAHG